MLYRLSDQQSHPSPPLSRVTPHLRLSRPPPTAHCPPPTAYRPTTCLTPRPLLSLSTVSRRVCTWIPPPDFPWAATFRLQPAGRGKGVDSVRVRGRAGHHDERDCPFRTANTAIGFLSVAGAAEPARFLSRSWNSARRLPFVNHPQLLTLPSG